MAAAGEVQVLLRKGVCRYLLEGRCKYGGSCWYSHDLSLPEDIVVSPETPTAIISITRDLKKFPPKVNDDAIDRGPNSANWVNAPEFVPREMQLQRPQSYAQSVRTNMRCDDIGCKNVELCTPHIVGQCHDPYCPYVHGDECDLCGKLCLHPYNEWQRKEHKKLCDAEIERDMEYSFAVQRSQDKTCGICMDVVMEKELLSDRRFGILEKCNHVFCLSCIRQWRRRKQLENENAEAVNDLDSTVTRTCPECRVASDFITPSQYWVESEEEKKRLIADYKSALSTKPCKHFKQGRGTCPFGGSCFYLHAKPDGTKVTLPPPVRRRRINQSGERDFLDHVYLFDYLDARDELDDGFLLPGIIDPMRFELDEDEIYDMFSSYPQLGETLSDDSDTMF